MDELLLHSGCFFSPFFVFSLPLWKCDGSTCRQTTGGEEESSVLSPPAAG